MLVRRLRRLTQIKHKSFKLKAGSAEVEKKSFVKLRSFQRVDYLRFVVTRQCVASLKFYYQAAVADEVGLVLYCPSWNAAYDLRKLRGKGFVDKVPKSRLYSVTSAGLQAMAVLMVIADKVIRPVLSGAGKPRPGKAPGHQSVIDSHYQKLQMEMRSLFQTLGVAIA